ncbi:MAG: hypothetical protein IPI67_37145 [Myxococcales bacterium]|nr:hypothetical protein [Myxococcales bacterium]
MKLYERADYANAAQAFLRADKLAPSEDALRNAIAAGRKASDHLLVARASRRAIERQTTGAELLAAAREALSQAAPHLGRLQLSCEPAPCELRVDEELAPAGEHWVLPGTRRIVARHEKQREVRELVLEPGATYRIVLRVVEPAAKPRARPPAPRPSTSGARGMRA